MKPVHFALLLAMLCGSGCVHNYTAKSVSRSGALSTNATALVALPEDGSFEKIPYPGSGHKAALAVSKAFAKHLRHVDVTPQAGTFAQQLAAARSGKFDYLVVPTVVHWEDRATEWSGRRDRIEIEIRTVEASSEKTHSLGSVTGKSKWATFGGDVPEDLLALPLEVYVDWLFLPVWTPLPQPRVPTESRPAQAPRH